MADPVKQSSTLLKNLKQVRRVARRIGSVTTGRGQGTPSVRADALADEVKTGMQSRGLTE